MEKEFLRYLRQSLDTIYDYFLSDAWLNYQTNIRILTNFVNTCAYHYPENKGKELFNNPTFEDAAPKMLWMSNSRKLIEISQEIHDRKRAGQNDAALCGRAKSRIRALSSTIPDNWIGRYPVVPEEVIKIIDKGSVYYDEETNR